MCRTYTIEFSKHPCTPHCGHELTARVRPCRHQGTPQCTFAAPHPIHIRYRCATHLQMTIHPAVLEFTKKLMNYTPLTTTAIIRTMGHATKKFQALHPSLQPHMQQWGYATAIAYQEEYYESARTHVYMRLHRGSLPQGVTTPPRPHGQILRELKHKLEDALFKFRCDDVMSGEGKYVRVGVGLEEQPEGGRFFFQYPLIGPEHFEQQWRDVAEGEGRAFHYTFADIFEGVGWAAAAATTPVAGSLAPSRGESPTLGEVEKGQGKGKAVVGGGQVGGLGVGGELRSGLSQLFGRGGDSGREVGDERKEVKETFYFVSDEESDAEQSYSEEDIPDYPSLF